MPSFSLSSVARATSEHFSLSLRARHYLVVGSQSRTYHVKARFPEAVDVILASDLVITLSGVVDGVNISSQDILASAATSHLVHYLKTNADQVGLAIISDVYVDEDDGLSKLTITSSRPPFDSPRPPHATLVSIDLQYIWKTIAYKPSGGSIELLPLKTPCFDPFSPRLLLPLESLLNDAVEKFVSLHLIKRYPLIFGSWRKKLDLEATFFPPIFHSVFSVMNRSSDASFREKCQRLIKTMVQQHYLASSKGLSALATYVSSISDEPTQLLEIAYNENERTMTDEEALCLSMEHLYRTRIRNPIIKGFTGTGSIGYDTDDELNIELSLSTPDDEGLDCFWNEPMLITDPVPKAIWTNDDWADNQGFWSAEEDSLVLGSPTLKKDVDLLTTTWNTATDSATDLYGSMEHPSLTSYSPSHISADLDQICTAVDWSRYNSHQNANQTVPWDDHHMTHDGSRKRQYEPDCSQELSLMSVLNDNTEYLQDTSGGFTSMCYDILDSDESNSDYETLSNPARTDMETFHHAVLEPKPRDEFETRIDAVGTLDGLISIDKDTNGERFVVSIEDFEIEGEEGLLDFEDELEDVELLCMYPIPLP